MLYFATHSILASNNVKAIVNRTFPNLKKYYRILFNGIALVTLLPLIYYTFQLDDFILWHTTASNYVGYIFTFFGILILLIAFKSFNKSEFFGLEQLKEIEQPTHLVTTGIYNYVRHPLYFGTIILFLGVFFLIPTAKLALINMLTFIYLKIGSRLEEKKLIAYFGQPYLAYKARVKGLIPYIL